MSTGIQKVAGDRLRDILRAMTTNRLTGVFTGFFTTSIIQSSSATTVMIVSFVNAQLLTLRQAIGVIMGANIGTTMTAWIIVFVGFQFKISDLALPILLLGVPLLFFRRERTRSMGEFIVGFGLLFLGLSALQTTVGDLNLIENEDFVSFISSMANDSIGVTLLFIGVGTLVTVCVQSSSAAMALTLTFIGAGLPLHLAAAIVLGENIGTTITANLAAIVGNKSAKRTGLAHLVFNLFGVLWMVLVFSPFLEMVQELFELLFGHNSDSTVMVKRERYSLALFHTCFNIFNTLLLISFVPSIEKLVGLIIPGLAKKEEFKLETIGKDLFSAPEAGLLQARKEISRFSSVLLKMNQVAKILMRETETKEILRLTDKLHEYEELTDGMEEQISFFLVEVSKNSSSRDISRRIRGLQTLVSDMERIGDLYFRLSKILERKHENKEWFTQSQRNNLIAMLEKLSLAIKLFQENLELSPKEINLSKAKWVEEEINQMRDEMLDAHLISMEKGEYKVKAGIFYKDLFAGIEKIGDYIINLSVILKSDT